MRENRKYQTCSRCVMDTSAENISFSNGVCNYCSEFLERSSSILFKLEDIRRQELNEFVSKVKSDGKGKKYDCIIGVSGGVDSSWSLVKAVELGLRPLAVHMDNGWNSELAQNNIENLVRSLGVDLFTHVINWKEYRSLMQAFFDADVLDIELLYDNAMLAVNYQQANANNVKYILAGTNQATEGMRMPPNWSWWYKRDKKNIKAIGRQFGADHLNTFPSIGTLKFLWYEYVKNISWKSFLNYFEYNKSIVLDDLEKHYGYRRYPYKHYESVFTRFYQGYILPKKFGVDKRRLHMSTLIISGQLSREDAIDQLLLSPYPIESDLERDKEYFLKKMDWSQDQLDGYLKSPERSHLDYPSEKALWDSWISLLGHVKRLLPN